MRGSSHTQLPCAPRQSGPSVCSGRELNLNPGEWTWQLTDEHIDELIVASQPYTNLPIDERTRITTSRFVLRTLAPELALLRERLVAGRGFELITGFPSNELPEHQSEAVFAGIGAHLGLACSQNAEGDLLGHVRNVGADPTNPTTRIYQTSERQTFHTDSADVVALLCLETAARGGSSLLASAGAIYNEMLDRDPESAALLFQPIATDRRGEVPEGEQPYFDIPVLSWYIDALTVMYQRQYIESAERFDGVDPLSPEIVAALDLFDDIANNPDFHIEMDLAVGDMQFVHNHSLLHDRTGFTDKPGSPRHLLRLWLSVPGDRELPEVFGQRFAGTTVGRRGGVVVRQDKPRQEPTV